jgi:hypothetical protein
MPELPESYIGVPTFDLCLQNLALSGHCKAAGQRLVYAIQLLFRMYGYMKENRPSYSNRLRALRAKCRPRFLIPAFQNCINLCFSTHRSAHPP